MPVATVSTAAIALGTSPNTNSNSSPNAKGAPSRSSRRQRPAQRLYLRDPRVDHAAVVVVELADTQHVPSLPSDVASLAAAAALCLAARVDESHSSIDAQPPQLAELCPFFADRGECPLRDGCPRVHATRATAMHPHHLLPAPASAAPFHITTTSNTIPYRPHVPPPQQQPQPHASYPASVGTFSIAHPNEATASMTVDATECFITKAVDTNGVVAAAQRPLGLCAHFGMKGLCLFGAGCSFVHHHGRHHASSGQGLTSPDSLQAVVSDNDAVAASGDFGDAPLVHVTPPIAGRPSVAPLVDHPRNPNMSSTTGTGAGFWPISAAAGASAPTAIGHSAPGPHDSQQVTPYVSVVKLEAHGQLPTAATTLAPLGPVTGAIVTTSAASPGSGPAAAARRFRHQPYGDDAGWQGR